jgi:predicted 3-demethylubiquinone-9 3-methyltransferase (glyoxalase superfamily)
MHEAESSLLHPRMDRSRDATGAAWSKIYFRAQFFMESIDMQKITPFLWFDGKAEEAANFYVSIFKNSKIGKMNRYGDHGPGPKGTVMIATFQIDGQEFIALNGGPQFKFSPATSFVVNCETQEEVDHFWEKLSAGGTKQQCGWLQDRFGVSWQIVPTALAKLMSDPDREKTGRVMQALMQMDKIDIKRLEQAFRQG